MQSSSLRMNITLDFTILSAKELKVFASKRGNQWAGRFELLKDGFDDVIYFRNDPLASIFVYLYIEMTKSTLRVTSATLKKNTTMLDDTKSIFWCDPHCFVRLRYWSIFVKAIGSLQREWNSRVSKDYLDSFISNLKLHIPLTEPQESAIRTKIKAT